MDICIESADIGGGEPELVVAGYRDLTSAVGLAVVLSYRSGT
jgi:hypothetical protein